MKFHHYVIVLFTSLFVSLNAVHAQLATTTALETAGVSDERLGRFANFLNRENEKGHIPGAVSLIARRGEIVHDAAYGYCSLTGKQPMRSDNIFHIMSMTKPIVTVAFMMLYEEGYFFLTDPVSEYLPQFKDVRVAVDVNAGKDGATNPADKEITIHHLLTHTAGFSHGLRGTELDNDIARALYYEPQKSIESRVNTLVSLPLIGQPGEQWYYSASPDVLSLLIEHFSGMSTAAFLQERIFDPLQMKDTGYNISKANQDRWVPVHQINEQGVLVNSERQLPIEGNTIYGGTHGLFSTAAVYMKFCRMLLNRGKANGFQFLSPNTVELMTQNHVGTLYQAPGQGFGLGFGVTTDVAESKSLGSEGQYYWNGAYCTYFFIDPEEELIAIVMSQLQPYSNFYGQKLRQYVYQTLLDQAIWQLKRHA
ncbi:MAG TPA: serine hydrolase domain-containing protein [Eudoraea sp.]|nr:serine hydrolase domain-containing protein [Eudoraea sp.]